MIVVLKVLICKYFYFAWELAMILTITGFFALFLFFACLCVCVCVCACAQASLSPLRHQIVRFEVVHVLWMTPHFNTIVVPLCDSF
jgi:hypothetical protein